MIKNSKRKKKHAKKKKKKISVDPIYMAQKTKIKRIFESDKAHDEYLKELEKREMILKSIDKSQLTGMNLIN
jgi:hypothetical protein